jgi:hypothetical protein
MVSGVVTTRSAGAPSLTFPGNTAPDRKVTVTLWPLARSNMGTSSSRTSRMAVDAMTSTSAACTAPPCASSAARQAAAAAIFDHITSSLGSSSVGGAYRAAYQVDQKRNRRDRGLAQVILAARKIGD